MSELLELATRVAGWARDGEAVEVYVSRGTDTEVKVYDGEVESLSSATSAGAGIRVVAGGRQGFAYAGALDEQLLAETLEEARDNATFATAEEWVGLPVPDGASPVPLDLWRDELASCPTDHKVKAAFDLEQRVKTGDPRIRLVESASWGDVSAEMAIASSLGITATDRSTACWLSAVAVAGDGDESQTAYGYSVGRAPSELDPGKASGDAVSRAVRLLGARQAKSAHLPVVFEPRVSAQLIGLLGAALSGEAVLKGISLFADRMGEPVGSQVVTLMDDPTNPLAFGASTFDDEGLACRRNTLVQGGRLAMFLYDTTTARRAGTASTASAVRAGFKSAPGVGARALFLEPGTAGPRQIMEQLGDCLLVQSLSGVHSGVNLISGDVSVGAEGILVKGGVPGEPVREVTIASSIQRMLQEVVAVGNDVEWLPSSAAGVTVAIGDMSMSGA